MSGRCHSLALPLSAAYAHDSRDGFSFFMNTTATAATTDESAPCEEPAFHPALERYLDDLCGFLRDARLIQSHPDNYFQFMRGETWAGSAVHFDGSPVDSTELHDTQRLLSGFEPLLRGEDAMMKLRALVRDGPPSCPASTGDATLSPLQALNAFYARTRQLMLGRTRRSENDAATITLLSPAARAAMDLESVSAQATRTHRQQIMDLVVSHGMNLKKQHEVRIMRDTIHDLVESCNAGLDTHGTTLATALEREKNTTGGVYAERPATSAGGADASSCSSAVRVETVINIGEGKGYVSRAVALCDNLQVIGLDCNPAHKERAVERIESLLETSLSSRDGRPRVNLLYEPRGHVASIACRVEEDVNWRTLLQGHVLTLEDPQCTCSAAPTAESPVEEQLGTQEEDRDEEEVAVGEDAGEHTKLCGGANSNHCDRHAEAVATLSRTRGEESVKLACRICGKVVRLENTTVIMKHVYTHLHEAKRTASSTSTTANNNDALHSTTSSSSSLIPSVEQLRTWNLTLSQHAYVAKLTEAFFSVTDVEAWHRERRKDAALLKRPREVTSHGNSGSFSADEEADEAAGTSGNAAMSYLTLQKASPSSSGSSLTTACDEEAEVSVTLQPVSTARGYRAVLLVARAVAAAATAPASTGGAASSDACDTTFGSKAVEVDKLTQEQEGEDGAMHDKQSTGLSAPTEQPSSSSPPLTWVYEQQTATVVGYDGGADCHQVCLDVENKKRVFRLYRLPTPSSLNPPSSSCVFTEGALRIGNWQLPDPAVWGRAHVALVLTVLPPALPSTPAVLVPSVRNAVLIGLHPCGDLGSNVCRIFRRSAARGLLLVSCCWHALTPHGFPLSRALQRRSMSTDAVSLLLATQPLDAWSTASPEGHRSSARLLFYRSLFKLLWARLHREWVQQQQQRVLPSSNTQEVELDVHASCEFPAAPPHLEPSFLRRMSRQKETLTFAEFTDAIAQEYLYKGTAKNTPYTPWNVGRRCDACRGAQEAFVRAALTERHLPAEMARAFEGDHFAQFLGLTVLRMWMCHLVESLLLLDRTLYLHEELSAAGVAEDSAVSLVPLFDGALSPRMYGVLARRGGSA